MRAQTNLDAEQIKAVDNRIGCIGITVFNAANHGEAEATKALQEMDAASRRRQP